MKIFFLKGKNQNDLYLQGLKTYLSLSFFIFIIYLIVNYLTMLIIHIVTQGITIRAYLCSFQHKGNPKCTKKRKVEGQTIKKKYHPRALKENKCGGGRKKVKEKSTKAKKFKRKECGKIEKK